MNIVFAAISFIGLVVVGVKGWGSEGHLITVRIAMSLLDERGWELVSTLLTKPGEALDQSFYEASIWPDVVQGNPAYAWARPMHFVNLPDKLCDGFKFIRDCGSAEYPGVCTVSAIGNYSSRVADATLSLEQRREALKFLIHFLADITQPLHVGFKGDNGGNKIKVTPPWTFPFTKAGKPILLPKRKPLHVLWDTHIIHYIKESAGVSWSELADELIRKLGATSTSVVTDSSDALAYASMVANNTADLSCTKAYKADGSWIRSGAVLPHSYYDIAADTIVAQLSKSGVDIATRINMIGRELVAPVQDDLMGDNDTDPDWENAFQSVDNEDELGLMEPVHPSLITRAAYQVQS